MAGETGGIGPTNLTPQPQVAAADNTRVVQPVPAAQPQPETAAPTLQPADQTQVAQQGSAPTQVSLVDPPQQEAAPPLQPAVEEPDLPSPASYDFPRSRNAQQVTQAFRETHGRRVLSGGTAEQMASAVLAQLGIDPGDQSAVVRLQRKIGAYPDGKFGPETWGKAIAYLTARHDRGDANAQGALTVLLTPTATGTGGGGAPARRSSPAPQPEPTAYEPPAAEQPQPTAPPEPEAPAELTESEVRAVLVEPSSQAMEKQLDDAWFYESDDVARRNMTNPSALFAMKPSTVAKHVKAMISGYTGEDEQNAIMTGLKAQAATGNLGATMQHLDLDDLKDDLRDEQIRELRQLAANPDSGVTAEQRQKLGS